MATKYKVTVTKIETDVTSTEQEWQKIGVKEDGDNDYGYVDKKITHDVSKEVYDQTVDELDMQKLVSVVNNLDQ